MVSFAPSNVAQDMERKEKFLWLGLCLVAICWIAKKYRNYFRAVWLALRLPGPPALPLLGNVLIIKDTDALLEIGNNISQLYAPLLRGWIFFVPIILVYEPDHLRVILGNAKTSDKNFFYRIMHTFVGDGLITSVGDRWKKHRRLIQPCFQINVLEQYFEDFVEASDNAIADLTGKRHVQITKLINSCVLKILHKTILGVDLKWDYDTPFRRGELLLIKRMLKPWLLWDSVFKHSEMSKHEARQTNDLHNYVKKILDKKLARRVSESPKTTCLLDRLIELFEAGHFTEEDVLNETVTFMLAGQDSVGAAVAFCLYHLAKYPHVQQRVYEEIDDVTGSDHCTLTKVDQLNQMHYLEQCIKETMRLLPSIPLVARVLTTDVKLGEYEIPSGTNIFVSPFATHRLPHIFPDPLRFDPDRFSAENARKIHPYGFLPFSVGPRNCIGYKFAYLEIKTIIASLLKSYRVALTPRHEDIDLSYRVTLRAKGGIWLDIQPRNHRYIDQVL